MDDQILVPTIRAEAPEASGQRDLASVVVELVRAAPYGLVPSLTWLKALVVLRGGWEPHILDDELVFSREWRAFRDLLRPFMDSSGRFSLERALPLKTWRVRREGRPVVVGDTEQWSGVVSADEIGGVLGHHLGSRSPRQRAEALEFEIDRVLASRGIPVRRGEEGFESDRVALVDGVAINLELRNFRDEIHEGLDADDRKLFRSLLECQAMPSVVVTGAPSIHLGRDVDEATMESGAVFASNVYVTGPVTSQEFDALVALDPPIQPVRWLDEDVVDRLVAELQVVAQMWRSHGSEVVSMARSLRTSETGHTRAADTAFTGDDVELGSVTELPDRGWGARQLAWRRVEEAIAMVGKDPSLARRQPEVAGRMRISVVTLQRAFRVTGVDSPFIRGNVRRS